MLMVTHACNLHCTYCYEAYKSGKMMSFETAKEILLEELDLVSNSADFDELEIDFMGGEPLLNYTLIHNIVEWFEGLPPKVPYVFFTTTNGTLMTTEMEHWFMQRKERFIMALSYDGTSEMQQENRGFHNKIHTEFFKTAWPFQPLKMTISKETLPILASGVIELQQQGYAVDAALAQGVFWTKPDALELRNQLAILREFYLRERSFKPIDMLAKSLLGVCQSGKNQCKFCGSATHMTTYDTDGEAYPCHMFTPIVLGKRALKLADAPMTDPALLTDPSCNDCFLRQWCPTCYGFNYRYRNELRTRDKNWCVMMHEYIRSVCQFQIEYYYDHRDELNEEDMNELNIILSANEIIQNNTLADEEKSPTA